MGRGIRASSVTAAPSLPKVSFQKIEDDVSTQPGGVHDLQARSYGYNDFSEFQRPDHYIRHIEPLEIDLARQVEYDMDEQDKEWLDAANVERKKDQLDKVTYEMFEIIMDRLEKEWFDLTKNIPKLDLAMPSEDSTCAICDDSEGENSNAIVFCDGCNLAVHQDCYGVPYIPEGQWLCRKCTVSPEVPVSCILCPNEGGAFKQTIHGEWVHLLCAIWVPETRVANDVFMEPITGVDKISKQRWKLKCSVCDIREGACIQCAKTSCFLAFHTTCARKEKLLLPMKSTQGAEPVTLTCYCERHLPPEQQEARATALANEEEEEDEEGGLNDHLKSSKSARAYAKTYKPGPPLVPAFIVNRILQYILKVTIRKKPEFVAMMCRYWSLKREARRGAPLLKRLHLEPWTANAGLKVQSIEERTMKLEQLQHLRKDLESVKELALLSRKRETRKLKQADIVQQILMQCLFPHEGPLRIAFKKIMGLDRQDYFKNPVSKTDVPDYFDIIKDPMCWAVIDSKLDKHEYWDISAFKRDIDLVVNNALIYNKQGTPFHKTALRIQTASKTILDELAANLSYLTSHSTSLKPEQSQSIEMDVDNPTTEDPIDLEPPIGDLEPPLDILELLASSDALKDDTDLILTDDPIGSLLNYELAQFKPPPPPPPPPPPKAPKPKRDRKAERERKRLRQEADMAAAAAAAQAQLEQVTLDSSPGFRAPRTRRAVAAAAAFEAEVHSNPATISATSATTPAPESPSVSEFVPATEMAAPEEVMITVPAKRGRKRGGSGSVSSSATGGRSDIPPMVQDVDGRGSFTLFDRGWILPSEQRRGGRAPVDRQAVPPPKKRSRLDRGTSRLSVITATSENQTLQSPLESGSAVKVDEAPETNRDYSVEMDNPEQNQPPAFDDADISMTVPPDDVPLIDGKQVRSTTGTIIIEQLDTPAIRKQKTRLRKEEKKRMAAVQSTGAESSIAGPSKRDKQETDSDLSSLSEFGSEEPEQKAKTGRRGRPPKMPIKVPRKAGSEKLEDIKIEGGTLVWAKAASFPWWPAVIFDDDHPEVPGNILQECKEARQKRKAKIHILRFFDKNSSWQYLDPDKLKLLGEDSQLDQSLLAPSSRLQRWKSQNMRQDCRTAYRRAIAEMETGSDLEALNKEQEAGGAEGEGNCEESEGRNAEEDGLIQGQEDGERLEAEASVDADNEAIFATVFKVQTDVAVNAGKGIVEEGAKFGEVVKSGVVGRLIGPGVHAE